MDNLILILQEKGENLLAGSQRKHKRRVIVMGSTTEILIRLISLIVFTSDE